MQLILRESGKEVACAIDNEAVLRSRAVMLVRARSRQGLKRPELVEMVKRRFGLDITTELIARIERCESLMVDERTLRALEQTLGLDAGTIEIPPAVLTQCLARLGVLLEAQGRLYGDVYADKLSDLLRPVRVFADQLCRGVIELREPNQAGPWLEGLYKSAWRIQAVAVPRYIQDSSSPNKHWENLMNAQEASFAKKCEIERIYVIDESRDDPAWYSAFESDKLSMKRMIRAETAKSMAAAALPDPKCEGADRLDFAIVDDEVIGITIFDKGIGSLFHFGDLEFARQHRKFFKSLWEEAGRQTSELTRAKNSMCAAG